MGDTVLCGTHVHTRPARRKWAAGTTGPEEEIGTAPRGGALGARALRAQDARTLGGQLDEARAAGPRDGGGHVQAPFSSLRSEAATSVRRHDTGILARDASWRRTMCCALTRTPGTAGAPPPPPASAQLTRRPCVRTRRRVLRACPRAAPRRYRFRRSPRAAAGASASGAAPTSRAARAARGPGRGRPPPAAAAPFLRWSTRHTPRPCRARSWRRPPMCCRVPTRSRWRSAGKHRVQKPSGGLVCDHDVWGEAKL